MQHSVLLKLNPMLSIRIVINLRIFLSRNWQKKFVTQIEAVTDTVETGRDIIIMLTVAENVKILETPKVEVFQTSQ